MPVHANNFVVQLHHWYDQLVRSDWSRDWTFEIQQKEIESKHRDEISTLQQILIWEYQRQLRFQESMQLIDKAITAAPDDPYVHFTKSAQMLYLEGKPQKALLESEAAILKAKQAKQFVFLTSSLRARAAVELNRFDLVQETLVDMMTWRQPETLIDFYPEVDFMERIPPSAIDPHIRREYLSFAANERRKWTANNPLS